MRRVGYLLLVLLGTIPMEACYDCVECTATQGDFGPVTREICGRRKDRAALVQELETDTVGTGPWICE